MPTTGQIYLTYYNFFTFLFLNLLSVLPLHAYQWDFPSMSHTCVVKP